jgi:hypothetical protein
MVRKFFIYLSYFMFVLFALALFIPKSSIYFLLEQELVKKKLVISNETPIENIFSLELEDAELSFDGVDFANVKSVEFTFFGVYNSIHLQNIELSSLVQGFLPSGVADISLNYTLANPFVVSGSAKGDFGEAEVKLSLENMQVRAVVQPSELMQKKYTNSLYRLKKEVNGEYSYAKTFQ